MYDNKIFSNQHCFKYSTETDFISVHILQDLRIHQTNWLSNLKLFNKFSTNHLHAFCLSS